MPGNTSIGDHWNVTGVYDVIVAALEESGKSLDSLTLEDMAPVDHFHARGFPSTVELADELPVKPGDHVVDLGCGLGGPARYMAQRFGCTVTGIDLTESFVDAARRFTTLLGFEDRVRIDQGDVQDLPYDDATFDGAYAQHVTMNIPDRTRLFAEVCRALKPGGFFAITEHGRGDTGELHHPVPWSEDGSGEFLVTPKETRRLLEDAGFVDVKQVYTGSLYLEAYHNIIELAAQGKVPPVGRHLLLGDTAVEKTRNSARNIEEGSTQPIRVTCCKPA